jgi:uncharacterized protein
MAEENKKLSKLRLILQKMGSMVLGFSGGVDSTFLAVVAHEELGKRFMAVIVTAPIYAKSEQKEAIKLARQYGFQYLTLEAEIWQGDLLKDNPKDRCYLCKKSLFTAIQRIAKERGYLYSADGSNYDDLSDFRPGRRAIKELGVRSPLIEAGLTKNDIRQLSKQMDLPTWNKPPMACLATRFPFGQGIDEQRLRMVDEAETYLRDIGFQMVRVRYIEEIARIELGADEINKLLDSKIRMHIVTKLKELGYKAVTLDLEGYRMGSMNPEVED